MARTAVAAKAAPAKAEKAKIEKVKVEKVKVDKTEKVKVDTVTARHLAATIAEQHEITKRQANEMLDDLVTIITKHLKKGARVRINGLGIMQVRKRPARMGRNPATGEAIKIKASKKVAFRPSKELKEAM